MRDLHHNITPARGISPAAAGTDNTAIVSQINDRAGYDSVEFIILIGANTDTNATFAVKVEESDDAGFASPNEVDDINLLGTEAAASFTAADDDNKVRKIGYVGNKRYQRVTITPSGNDSGNIFVAGVWLNGHPRHAPV